MQVANMNSPKRLKGLEEIAPYYDGFILDLWGVVHDGIRPFPDTIRTLEAMKEARRIVWLLSNAPRRAHIVRAQLAEMGVHEGLYDGLLTSGEATHNALRDTYLEKFGRRCFHLGPARDVSLFEGLDIETVKDVTQADFILNSGIFDMNNDTPDHYRPLLEQAAGAGVPMICANPDKVVYVGDQLVLCPGTLADIYERMDQKVVYFGKPHRGVYRQCLESMGVRKVLGVGDAMATDIAGAVGAGIDGALVMSGIHRNDLFEAANLPASENRLQGFLKPYPFRPHYLLDHFGW